MTRFLRFAWIACVALTFGLAQAQTPTSTGVPAWTEAPAQKDSTIIVTQVSGKVMVLDADSNTVSTLSQNSIVTSNQIVVTQTNGGSVDLAFSNGSTLGLQSGTNLWIKQYTHTADQSTTQLHLSRGSVIGEVTALSQSSSYEIDSPVGSAGIRGTLFNYDMGIPSTASSAEEIFSEAISKEWPFKMTAQFSLVHGSALVTGTNGQSQMIQAGEKVSFDDKGIPGGKTSLNVGKLDSATDLKMIKWAIRNSFKSGLEGIQKKIQLLDVSSLPQLGSENLITRPGVAITTLPSASNPSIVQERVDPGIVSLLSADPVSDSFITPKGQTSILVDLGDMQSIDNIAFRVDKGSGTVDVHILNGLNTTTLAGQNVINTRFYASGAFSQNKDFSSSGDISNEIGLVNPAEEKTVATDVGFSSSNEFNLGTTVTGGQPITGRYILLTIDAPNGAKIGSFDVHPTTPTTGSEVNQDARPLVVGVSSGTGKSVGNIVDDDPFSGYTYSAKDGSPTVLIKYKHSDLNTFSRANLQINSDFEGKIEVFGIKEDPHKEGEDLEIDPNMLDLFASKSVKARSETTHSNVELTFDKTPKLAGLMVQFTPTPGHQTPLTIYTLRAQNPLDGFQENALHDLQIRLAQQLATKIKTIGLTGGLVRLNQLDVLIANQAATTITAPATTPAATTAP